MVTTYDVLSSRWSSHFWVKMPVLTNFFHNKSKTCQWNDAKGLFQCNFTCEAEKIIINRDFNLISISWWKSKMATIGDVTGLQQHHLDQRLSTEGKIVSKYCKLSWSKTLGRGSIHPSPLHHAEIWICVCVRGLNHVYYYSVSFAGVTKYL